MKCSVGSCQFPAVCNAMCKTHYGRWKKHGDARPELPIAHRVKEPLGEWRKEAACLGADPRDWFPEDGEAVTRGVAVCERCPVRSECLEHAMDNFENDGVWGGLSASARRKLRTRRNAARRREGSA